MSDDRIHQEARARGIAALDAVAARAESYQGKVREKYAGDAVQYRKPEGKPMSQVITKFYAIPQFESLLNDAGDNASNAWESEFIDDLKTKYDQYGERMFISARQMEVLEKIAEGENHGG